jgi:hypothetical protein
LHSTVAELAGMEEHPGSPFPIERFILVSLILRALVILLSFRPDSVNEGTFAALVPEPRRHMIGHLHRRPRQPRPNQRPRSPTRISLELRRPGRVAVRAAVDQNRQARARQNPAARRRGGREGAPKRHEARLNRHRRRIKPSGSDSAAPGGTRTTPLWDWTAPSEVRGARSVASGAPQGPRADSWTQPVSFDPTWYDWGPYAPPRWSAA